MTPIDLGRLSGQLDQIDERLVRIVGDPEQGIDGELPLLRRKLWNSRLFGIILILLLVIAIMVAGVGIIRNRGLIDRVDRNQAGIQQTQLEACERDNVLRQANHDLWAPVLERNPPQDPGPDATPEEQQEYEDDLAVREIFIQALREGFALHAC